MTAGGDQGARVGGLLVRHRSTGRWARVEEAGLCKLCREEAAALAAASAPAAAPRQAGPATAEPQTCSGRDGDVPCVRMPLPNRSVCGVHRVQELAGEVA